MKNNEIKLALKHLGINGNDVSVINGNGVAKISVKGEYIGIWDYARKTFVD